MLTLSDSLRQRFLRLALVNVLSNLMVPLAGLVDSAFLGHLVEIRHLAGVALATALFNYLYRPCNFLRMGTTGPTAQAEASGDSATVILILLRNGLIAIALGTLILLLQSPLRQLGFTLLRADPSVMAAGQTYYSARIWDAPATLLNFVLIGWLLGRERSGQVLLLSALSNGANILLDYWLIVRWGWESFGAGVATAASQYLMLLVGLILIVSETPLAQWRSARHLFDWTALSATFRLNANIWVRSLVFISVYAFFTSLSASLGTVPLATNALLLQVMILAIYFIDGLAFATESLTGSLQGAGTLTQLKPLLKLSSGIGLALGLGFAILFALAPEPLFGLLTNHGEIIEQVERYVFWLLPILGFGSLAFVLDGYFLGLTAGEILRNSMILAAIVGFGPLAIASWQLGTNQLLWSAMAAFMTVRVAALASQVPKTLVAEAIPQPDQSPTPAAAEPTPDPQA